MAGHKDNIVSFAVAAQPEPGVFVQPDASGRIAISSPDDGSDPITGEDPTLTGAIWAAPRQFLGRRGRAGATFVLRGPGGAAPFAAGSWAPGLILQAAGFTEILNPTAITAAAGAGGTTSSIVLDAAAPAVTDLYKGMLIEHAGIGDTVIRRTSMIRSYDGATKTATLMETVANAIVGGNYTIPPQVAYVLSAGSDIPALSVEVIRHRVARKYKDCALNSFAITIPTANDTSTDAATVEFSMLGVPVTPNEDKIATPIPTSLLRPAPLAKAGKFALNGVRIGHQSMRLEFGLEAGAPPNVNFDAGQEQYETLSGTRTVNLDLNQTLVADLDLDPLVDAQTAVPILEGYGGGPGDRIFAGVMNALLDPFSPTGRNGFVGLTGNAVPQDADRAMALSFRW